MEVEKNVFASVVEAMILKVGHPAVVDVNSSMYDAIHSVDTVMNDECSQSNRKSTVGFSSVECCLHFHLVPY